MLSDREGCTQPFKPVARLQHLSQGKSGDAPAVAATAHVECRKDAGVIDESPAAYKDIDAVMAAQRDLVEVVHTLRQVVCIKG